MTWGRRPSIREPIQFWGVEQGGHHQLVPDAWVVVVLVVNGVLELKMELVRVAMVPPLSRSSIPAANRTLMGLVDLA